MSLSVLSKLLSQFQSYSSQQDQQPRPVCRWSAHASRFGPPRSFFRHSHTLSATATAAGKLFLFGGYAPTSSSNDLYVISTWDFSTTLLHTRGEVPSPRGGHDAALTSTNLLIWGGDRGYMNRGKPVDDSLYLLNLVSREWTRIVANGTGPGVRYWHTVTMVGSKFFVFGGQSDMNYFNDMWALDLNSLKSRSVWESYEPTPGNKKPLPRSAHVSVTTEDHIIVFGGYGKEHRYNDTWSFNISTREWTELQCTGSIPSPRAEHAAVLVDDVMYVFGGSADRTCSDDLYALQLSTQRWFNFRNVGTSPPRRKGHTMASDGTRVFVVGGTIKGVQSDEMPFIHVFDTEDIKYPEPEHNAVDPNENTTHFARKLSTGPLTQEQPQHPKSSSSEAHSTSRLQKATPAVSGHPSTMQITHERNPSPKGRPSELTGVNSKPRRVPKGDVSEGSTEYHAKFVAPHSSDVTRLELERQLSILLAAQTERDQRIARLTDELALKSTLLEQSEANAAEASEASKRARLELREHADRLLTQTSLVKQRDAELVDMQARLDRLLISRDQQVGQYEKELTNVRAKLDAKESELKAVRSRLTDAEKGWTKSNTETDTIRAQTATGSVNRDEDRVTRRLMERVRAIEAEMASRRWNEKSIEEMECRNEGDMEYRNEVGISIGLPASPRSESNNHSYKDSQISDRTLFYTLDSTLT